MAAIGSATIFDFCLLHVTNNGDYWTYKCVSSSNYYFISNSNFNWTFSSLQTYFEVPKSLGQIVWLRLAIWPTIIWVKIPCICKYYFVPEFESWPLSTKLSISIIFSDYLANHFLFGPENICTPPTSIYLYCYTFLIEYCGQGTFLFGTIETKVERERRPYWLAS